MLQEFGPSLFSAEGPTVSFFGFPYPTRMAAARLSDGSLWVWSPVALTRELAKEVESIGPVRYIVSPNKLHHLFLHNWADRWPEARLYAPPGLGRKRPDLRFYAQLEDEPSLSWAPDIDQAVFRGSIAMEEVAFFHRASRTAIIGDLIQRHSASKMSGWKGMLHAARRVGRRGREYTARVASQLSATRPGPRRTKEGARMECQSASDRAWRLYA
jgi:hypothetical protein